jgi:hypothetical protein
MAASKSQEAVEQELPHVRPVDRNWISDHDLRSRLFVERTQPRYFVRYGFRQIPPLAINSIEWDTEHHFFPFARTQEISPVARDSHDLFPGFRGHFVPRSDRFAQSRIGAGRMQTRGDWRRRK